MNGDGAIDLVTSSGNVLLGGGDGTFVCDQVVGDAPRMRAQAASLGERTGDNREIHREGMGRLNSARSEPHEAALPDITAIFKRYGQNIERWASRLGGPLVDSDDVVQDVFAVVHRRIGELRPDVPLTSWLYRITQNIATTRRRRERLRRWTRGLSFDYADELPAPGPSAIDEMERREAALEVYSALDCLDEKYRSAVILFEIEGLTGEEIATLTGRPLATIWIHLHRGRQKFRRHYQKQLQKRGRP
jgi:RNA polymerase sigma-70 factor, ECF subfamily